MAFSTLRLGHTSRSFLREIVIVVVGVLIALVLQEAVSNWQDQRRTKSTLASMRGELADFGDVAISRVRTHPCIVAKLDGLESKLAKNGAVGPWTNIGRPGYFFSSQGAWNSSSSDLLSRQMQTATFNTYGLMYRAIAQFDALAEHEQEQWIVLGSLEYQDVPVAGERRWQLLQAIAGARNEAMILNAIAQGFQKMSREVGIAPNDTIPDPRKSSPLCQPLGTEPSKETTGA
jgi:hypothetical protein